MFDRIGRGCIAIYDYFYNETYPIRKLRKIKSKPYQGSARKLFVDIIGGFGTCYCAVNACIWSANFGRVGGLIVGGAIGTLVMPGAGTAIGSAIGGSLGGAGGAIIGWKSGIELGGFCAINIAKQIARAISALFNFNEVNPTYPYKYKLSKEKEKFMNGHFASKFIAQELQKKSSQTRDDVTRNIISNESVHHTFERKPTLNSEIINKRLAKCYQWKKKNTQTKFISDVTHFYKRYNDDIKALNRKIDKAIDFLQLGYAQAYHEVKSEIHRRNQMI